MMIAVGGCAAQVSSPDARFMSGIGLTGDMAMPVESVQDRKFRSVIRQRYDFSCGSAALATLLHYHYDDKVGESQVFLGMWKDGDRDAIRKVGFSLLDMKRYLGARGLSADGFKVTLDQIGKTGIPGIALITVKKYRHFVVVKGVTADSVLIGDPSTGLHAMPRAEFETVWNGIYFVLNAAQDRGRANFNSGSQWAALTRAPIGDSFHDPLSQQALSLTAPFYRDF